LDATYLSKAYRNEHSASVKERLLLVIRIFIDNQDIKSVASELHKSRSWAYKWYKRYKDEGLEGLRDKPRSGKPPTVSNEIKERIKQELSSSNTGWETKEVIDYIQNKTGVKYHEVHIRRLLHRWGFSLKAPKKRFVRRASDKDVKDFKKSKTNTKHA